MNWLLLRGLYRQKLHWGEFPTLLQARYPGRRILMIDHPGCGEAAGDPAPWTIAKMTESIRAHWLKKWQEQPGSWGILAVSLGAMVAMDWCNRHSSDFERLVVINSSARNVGSPFERFNLAHLPKVLRLLGGADSRALEAQVLNMTTSLKGAPYDQALERNCEIAQRNPIPTSVAIRQLVAASRFEAPVTLRQPTLVIRSHGDKLVSPRCSERLSQRLGARLVEHSWGGHDLPLDDPEWVVRTVADHVPSST